ncbi:hypothetical protein [Actinoallomurus iriomotensis]|uniref:Uncharacterized protein n=1 Tax=Actinoallomurus iriomotensis TaxID=478107 RepID=A0A9W6VXV8_9ACTN|nr:hypothetical protein [Actinoallomurus iriomotensis]GLY83664.1 hypothetical protein Airi02_015930 [Actinoallomurus iriomotensis]
MGRRRRRWREPVYVWWVAIAALMLASVLLSAWRLALLALLMWCVYEFALNPTVCRVMTRQGFACHEPVRGRLFACSSAHQRVKNDAIWRAAGLPNPFARATPHDPNRDTGVVVYSPAVRARLAQNDRIILTIAGVVGLVVILTAVVGIV